MKCSKCDGQLEKIHRAGVELFYHCRPCKLPHDGDSNPLLTVKELSDRYNPLQGARDAIKKAHPKASSVSKTSLEVALLQALQEAYFSGIKDGVLLAYSQDIEEGEPMEKLGVSNEQLKVELQTQYNELKERKINLDQDPLNKQASAQVHYEMEAVKAKLDEIESQPEA